MSWRSRWQPRAFIPFALGLATGLLERSLAGQGGLGGLGGGDCDSAGFQGRRSSRRVPPSVSSLPFSLLPWASPLLQLAPSRPEQFALLCPLGPLRAWLSPALCNWPGSYTVHHLPAESSPPPPHRSDSLCKGWCSSQGVGIRRVPKDAPRTLPARAWELGALLNPVGSTALGRAPLPRSRQNWGPGVVWSSVRVCLCAGLPWSDPASLRWGPSSVRTQPRPACCLLGRLRGAQLGLKHAGST